MLPLSEIYFRNRYEVELSDATTFTFSLQTLETDPFFSRPFAIITAGNPKNIDLSIEENSARNALLYSELNSNDVLNAKGCYLEHCEEGYLIYDLPLDTALALGRKYEQVAIFYNDTKRLMYVDCYDEGIISERAVE